MAKKNQLELRKTKKQTQFELEIDVAEEINDKEDCVVSGNMTFLPKAGRADGSFSLKITSSLLSTHKSERAAVLKAFADGAAQAYDALLEMKQDYEDGLLSANGQTHLQKELDAATQPNESLPAGFGE